MIYRFRLVGQVVPCARMTQRSKFVNPQARRYLAWQEAARLQFKAQMAVNGWQMIPRGVPLAVSVVVRPCSHRRDADNELKACLDAAQHVVYENDCWIDEATIRREPGEAGVVVVVRRIGEGR